MGDGRGTPLQLLRSHPAAPAEHCCVLNCLGCRELVTRMVREESVLGMAAPSLPLCGDSPPPAGSDFRGRTLRETRKPHLMPELKRKGARL